MGMITSVAVETLLADKSPRKGGVIHLEMDDATAAANPTSRSLFFDITNEQGYAIFKQVPVPFGGILKLGGSIAYKEYPITIPANAVNVTLRVGGVQVNPNDIILEHCDPFV